MANLPEISRIADQFLARTPDLANHLEALVREIPPGRVSTYGAIATALGDVIASRWVAQYLLDPTSPVAEQSHRIIRSTGQIGLFCHGTGLDKAALLKKEGVGVRENKIALKEFGMRHTRGKQPLVALRNWQSEFNIPRTKPVAANEIKTIAGIDISYAQEKAVAVCALFDAHSLEMIEYRSEVMSIRFPYITGYLAFREIPVYLRLLATCQQDSKLNLPDLILVDGNGALHPRRCGIATMLGVLTNRPTIGVAKKLIYGTVTQERVSRDEAIPVQYSSDPTAEVLGFELLSSPRSKKGIYVSRGFRVDDAGALYWVRRCLKGRRSPEPIYQADRISREIASRLSF